jgi:hypothetical protein
MQFTCGKLFNSFTGIAGVPPAMSAKREKALSETNYAPAARCGRDARDPSMKMPLKSNCITTHH